MSETLYRKYRPQVFDDLVGQDHIVRTLKNSLANDKVSHAYLFTGPRGTGKTTTARILAKSLLCEHGPTPDPDGTCEECRLIAEAQHPDVSELDAASRTGVENVRDEIISRVNYAPVRGNYKVYIIDEVHMLSVAAFNALLKTLEEPPEHVVFILCTTDPQKVPETIHSRCQRFDFRPINAEELTGRLGAVCNMENVEFEGEALDLIARRSNGGLRDALTFLEQVIAYGEGKVTTEIAERMLGRVETNDMNDLCEAIAQNKLARGLEFVDRYAEDGVDLAQFIDDLAMRFRNIYVVKLVGCDVALQVSGAELDQIKAEAEMFSRERLEYLLTILREESPALKRSSNQRLSFELTLFKLMNPQSELSLESLNSRIAALEAGAVSAPVAATTSAKAEAPKVEVKPEQGKAQPTLLDEAPAEVTQVAAVAQTPVEAPVEEKVYYKAEAPAPSAKKGIWAKAYEFLEQDSPSIAALVEGMKPEKQGKTITFKLGPNKGFSFLNLNKPASKQAIVAALEKAGLVGTTVEVVKVDSISESSEVQTATFAEEPEPVAMAYAYSYEPESVPAEPESVPAEPESVLGSENEAEPGPEGWVEPAEDEPVFEPEVPDVPEEDSEIEKLNDILSGAFGDGLEFKEVE